MVRLFLPLCCSVGLVDQLLTGSLRLTSLQPDFSETPLESDEQVAEWLKFYECHAPLVCLSVFVSHDPVSLIDCHLALSPPSRYSTSAHGARLLLFGQCTGS